jgi:hypothetical protein
MANLNDQNSALIEAAIEKCALPGEEVDFGHSLTLIPNASGQPVTVLLVVLRIKSLLINQHIALGCPMDSPAPSPAEFEAAISACLRALRDIKSRQAHEVQVEAAQENGHRPGITGLDLTGMKPQ